MNCPRMRAAVYRRLDPERLPQHVAIIMDGNGRWAGKRSLKRSWTSAGCGGSAVCSGNCVAHRAAVADTLYAFSLENNLSGRRRK